MAGSLGYRVHAGDEYKRVEAALRAVGKSLPDQLREEMAEAVAPLVARVKQNVRSIPAAGRSGSTGLRQRVARGVRVQQTGRAALRVVATMARPDEESLPLGLDSPSGWRHPVFGHRDRWVTQRTRGSWFRDEIAAGGDEVQRRLHAALERAAQTIAAAGSG